MIAMQELDQEVYDQIFFSALSLRRASNSPELDVPEPWGSNVAALLFVIINEYERGKDFPRSILDQASVVATVWETFLLEDEGIEDEVTLDALLDDATG